MKYTEPHSGITVSGSHPFAKTFIEVSKEAQRDEKAWIDRLIKKGIKAAHPDDGRVNREENTVTFSYPYFDFGVEVGDKIVLGWPDKYRVVKVKDITHGRIGMLTYYHF